MTGEDRASGDSPVECQLCHAYKEFGHLDPDNLRWYCEECWRGFSGEQRTCFLCRQFVAKGAVDRSDKRWYCNSCWDRYVVDPRAENGRRSAASPPSRHSSPPRRRSREHRRSRSRRRSSGGATSDGHRLPTDSWRAPPLSGSGPPTTGTCASAYGNGAMQQQQLQQHPAPYSAKPQLGPGVGPPPSVEHRYEHYAKSGAVARDACMSMRYAGQHGAKPLPQGQQNMGPPQGGMCPPMHGNGQVGAHCAGPPLQGPLLAHGSVLPHGPGPPQRCLEPPGSPYAASRGPLAMTQRCLIQDPLDCLSSSQAWACPWGRGRRLQL